MHVNKKKADQLKSKNNPTQAKGGSSFIKGATSSKPSGGAKKVRSTGANRGS